MDNQIDIEELIDANIQNNLEGENNVEPFKTNIPPKWSTSFDDNNYKLIGSNGFEFKHDNVRNNKLFEDVGTVEPLPLFTDKPFGIGMGTMQKLENYKALINTHTGDVLNCRPISNTYKLVNHSELFEKQGNHLKENSDLPLDNVEVIDRVYENGRRASRTIHFNDLKMDVGKNDLVKCRLDVFNSVDMSWAFQVFSGAYRSLCRNTQVFGGEKSYQQKHLHTQNLDVDALMNNAQTSLSSWNNNKEQMLAWKRSPISDKEFATFLAKTLCQVERGVGSRLVADSEYKVNNKLLNFMTQVFQKESQDCGSNMWSAYNALTYWSTHTDAKYVDVNGKDQTLGETKSKHTVQLQRQDKVRKLLSSDSWNELELVA
tara:strand:+ start:1689 stop:2807 length:1119 start_codon:yes stop_codon:yes gene_type:complete